MKMTAKMFGVLCAASLVFCAACNNMVIVPGGVNDNGSKPAVGDEGDKDNDEVTYDVGTIVEFNGKDYLVTKNTEATDETRAMVNTAKGQYYLNENASVFRETLLARYGVTNYVELFDIAEDKAMNSSNQAQLYDTFMILRSGKGVYRIKQRWISKDLFSTLDAEAQNKSFEAIENNVLRELYDPDFFIITNTMFETDVAKKFQHEYAFDYDNSMRVDFSDTAMLSHILKRAGYVSINGTTKSVYAIRDKRQRNAFLYELENYNVSRFFEFGVYPDYYQLTTQGDGEFDGSASDSVYKGTLTIYSVQYDSSGNLDVHYSVGIKKNGNTVNDFEQPTGIDNEYVKASSIMVSVEGVSFKVPATITFSVPFADSSAVLNKYTKVTFIPEPKNGGVVYVPKTDNTYPYEFIAQFVKDYPSLYAGEFPSL